MFDDDVIFDLNSSDCFDKVVVPFKSRIPVWEFPGRINAFISREDAVIITLMKVLIHLKYV